MRRFTHIQGNSLRRCRLKINFVGLVACLLVGISLVAPWVSTQYPKVGEDGIWSVLKEFHLSEIRITNVDWVEGFGWVKQQFSFVWFVLAFLAVGIALGVIGSFKMHSKLLVCGGTSVFVSLLLFGVINWWHVLPYGYIWPPGAFWFDIGFYMCFVGMLLLYFSSFVTADSRFIVTTQQRTNLGHGCMFSGRFFTNSRIFLCLGISLLVFAATTFPMKVPVNPQPKDIGQYMDVGWWFAPIVGIWGLASIVLGVVQSSLPKRTIKYCLITLLALFTISLGYVTCMVPAFNRFLIRGVISGNPFYLLRLGLILVPSLLIYAAAINFLKPKYPIDFLKNYRLRVMTVSTMAAVPILYASLSILQIIYL